MELLNCPFCGGEMQFRGALWPSEGDTEGVMHANATDCGMTEFHIGAVDESTIAAWNRRAAALRAPADPSAEAVAWLVWATGEGIVEMESCNSLAQVRSFARFVSIDGARGELVSPWLDSFMADFQDLDKWAMETLWKSGEVDEGVRYYAIKLSIPLYAAPTSQRDPGMATVIEQCARLIESRGQCAVVMNNADERIEEKKAYAWDCNQHAIAIRALATPSAIEGNKS